MNLAVLLTLLLGNATIKEEQKNADLVMRTQAKQYRIQNNNNILHKKQKFELDINPESSKVQVPLWMPFNKYPSTNEQQEIKSESSEEESLRPQEGTNLDMQQDSFEQEILKDLALQRQWKQYKEEFEKTYDTDIEDNFRLSVFKENSKIIDEHNQLYSKGHYSYELGHNQFSDLTHKEYLEQYTLQLNNNKENEEPTIQYNGEPTVKYLEPTVKYDNEPTVKYDNEPTVKYNVEPTVKYDSQPTVKFYNDEPTVKFIENTVNDESPLRNDEEKIMFMPPANVELPISVDWRVTGAVTPVKNEGKCGASWAFSATGALEGQLFRKTHHLIPLSEQNLLDCTFWFGKCGRQEGSAEIAYKYIMTNGGIDTNSSYPWLEKASWFCHYQSFANNPKIRQVVHIQKGNEYDLASAVATIGPIAIAVDASSSKFRFYRSGIFNLPDCSSSVLNREMLVVGYGRAYWVTKNSWGKGWGVNGYIYMTRNGRNQCGIVSEALYPIV